MTLTNSVVDFVASGRKKFSANVSRPLPGGAVCDGRRTATLLTCTDLVGGSINGCCILHIWRPAVATVQQALLGFATDTAVDLSRRDVQERLSRSAVPAFFKIAEAWQLRDEAARQLLGGVSNGVFYQLKSGHKKTLDQDKLTRISLLLGIFRALNILYSRRLADGWMTLPNLNLMFQGETPLNYSVKHGVPGLVRLRQLLDARRGGR